MNTTAIQTRFSFYLREGERFGNSARNVIAISPDGTQVVYAANQQLYLRRIDELEARIPAVLFSEFFDLRHR